MNCLPFHFITSTFRRKKVKLLSSQRRQRLGGLSFRISFLSESISQKLSKVSIWNLEYLFTIKRGTNYNKADDPVICILLFPLFDLEFLQKIQFLNNYDRHWNETQHTCSLSNGEPITNKAGDPVICISRVICPCFDIVHRNLGYFFSIIKISQ